MRFKLREGNEEERGQSFENCSLVGEWRGLVC